MADVRKFTRKEIAARNSKSDAVFVIENRVYDVTAFLDDHPGGHEVLLHAAGRDATEDFDDIGHSLDARELMGRYLVGEVADGDRLEARRKPAAWQQADAEAPPGLLASWQLPVLLGLLATLLYTYLF